MARHNNVMTDQLKSLRGQVRRHEAPKTFPSPSRWVDDGVDHINIYKDGKTELGRLLVNESNITLNHHLFGHFNSVEAFSIYIQSDERDDRVRGRMHPKALKEFSKSLTPVKVLNLNALIMDAAYQRIIQHPALAEAVKESTLPFEFYFVHNVSKVRIRPKAFEWALPGFEEIRKALKEERDPDFSFLLDRPGTGIYDFVLPQKPAETPKEGKKKNKYQNQGIMSRIRADAKAQEAAAAKPETPVVEEPAVLKEPELEEDMMDLPVVETQEALRARECEEFMRRETQTATEVQVPVTEEAQDPVTEPDSVTGAAPEQEALSDDLPEKDREDGSVEDTDIPTDQEILEAMARGELRVDQETLQAINEDGQELDKYRTDIPTNQEPVSQ